MVASPSDSSVDDKIRQMVAMLDDPDVGEAVKLTIRDGLQKLAQGGFEAAYENQLRYSARNDLRAFAEYVYGLPPFPHHEEIIKVLEDPTRERVLIVAPPNHAKSTVTSNHFLSWYMAKYPENAAILVQQTMTQATETLGAIRSTIQYDDKYQSVFPDAKPDEARGFTREKLFITSRKKLSRPDPNLMASGNGGPIQGRRAELIVVDDLVDEAAVQSEKIMRDTKSWFKTLLLPRLNPGGRCIVICTRWGMNDLAGMLVDDLDFEVLHMAAEGDEYGAYVDHLPPRYKVQTECVKQGIGEEEYLENLANRIAENEGYQTRVCQSVTDRSRFGIRKYIRPDSEAGVLWPEARDQEYLDEHKRGMGTVTYSLVYQGDPAGLQGDIFKRDWFRYYGPGDDCSKRAVPDDAYWFQSVDVAVSTKQRADFTVVATVAFDREGNFYVHDIDRVKMEAPEQPKLVEKNYKRYPKTLWVLIETVAYQLSLFQNVIKKGIPARAYKPMKNKEMRARSASAVFEAHKVFFRKDAMTIDKWLTIAEDEFTSFPRGEHDDVVDAISSLIEELSVYFGNPEPVEVVVEFGMDDD